MNRIYLRKAIKLYNNSAFIDAIYNPELITFIKQKCTEFFWHKQTKLWEIPIGEYRKILARFPNFIVVDETEEDLLVNEKAIPVNLPKGFKFKTTPKKHQLQTITESQNRFKFLLADTPGCGKSKQIIDIARLHKYLGNIKHCLIICGVNNSKWNWVNEIKKHSDEKYILLGERKRKNGNIYEGSNLDREADCKKLKDELFVVTNIQSLRDERIVKALQNIEFGMIALDESHKCKNPQADQTKGFLKLNAKIKIPATGTPVLNKPLDLYVTLKWLEKENHSFGVFQNHYCIMGGFGGYQVVGYKNMKELKDRVDDIQVRRKLEDCIDIPPIIFKPQILCMTDEQWKLYISVKNGIIENIDKIIKSPNPLTEFIRLRQVTSNPNILFKTGLGVKFERAIEICQDARECGKKVLIYSNWTQVIEPLHKLLKEFNPALIVGGMGNKVEAEKNKLNNDDSCFCATGTIGAMGTTHNLPGASWVVFIDEPWTDADEIQCIDRTRRLDGVKFKTIVHHLICKNTIDERVRDIVRMKKGISEFIVDGKINLLNKEKLIKFLLSEEE